MSSDPMARQIGGVHYKDQAIQPFEYAHRNNMDPTSFSVLKYLSRFRKKDGLKDLQKSLHIVEIREQMLILPNKSPIGMMEYIDANKLSGADAVALATLDDWLKGRVTADTLKAVIQVLIDNESESNQLAFSAI